MRVMRWLVLVAAVLAIGVYVSPVYADPIGPDGCSPSSCFGGIWTLQYAPAGGTTYDIFYTVNTAGMSNATFGDILQIGFKVSSSVVSASLLSEPAGWGTNAQANSGLDQAGCTGTGSGFVCSQGLVALTVPDGTYTWEFLVDIGGASLLTAPGAATIKANGTAPGAVLSADITLQPVPEPTTLLLAGSALVGIGIWSRRRWVAIRSSAARIPAVSI
jgi:hypothetical protein